MQRCLSGLRSTIGNRVCAWNVPEVRILFSAPNKRHALMACFLFWLVTKIEEDSWGEPWARASVLPAEFYQQERLRAKWTIDNCPAGRAAKGANPLLCAKQRTRPCGVSFALVGLRELKRIRGTSCPLSKALIMPCRDEMSERRLVGVNVTERKEQLCAREPWARATPDSSHARNDVREWLLLRFYRFAPEWQ